VDRVSTKTPRRLKQFDALDFFYHSTNEDPILQELAQEEDAGNVYATDSVLAHIMTCSRSVLPWDIVITYLPGGIIFLDHRDAYKLEALTVNETAHVPPSEEEDEALNSREKLTEEATFLHQMFSQQVRCRPLSPTLCGRCLAGAAALAPAITAPPRRPVRGGEELTRGHTKPAAAARRERAAAGRREARAAAPRAHWHSATPAFARALPRKRPRPLPAPRLPPGPPAARQARLRRARDGAAGGRAQARAQPVL
jgi:hypothetical protein